MEADAGEYSPSAPNRGQLHVIYSAFEEQEHTGTLWLGIQAYLSIYCPLLHLLFVCSAVRCFWNELSVHKLRQKSADVTEQKRPKRSLKMVHTAGSPTSVVSTWTGSAYFSVGAPSWERMENLGGSWGVSRKVSPKDRWVVLYRFLMAAAHPGTPLLQVAPPVPPPGRFHSDEAALYQSTRCAAPCAACPSGTCLEHKGPRVKDKTHAKAQRWSSRAKTLTSGPCHSLVPTFQQLPQV